MKRWNDSFCTSIRFGGSKAVGILLKLTRSRLFAADGVENVAIGTRLFLLQMAIAAVVAN